MPDLVKRNKSLSYVTFGRTGWKVSEVCAGTMTWGSFNAQEAEAHAEHDYDDEEQATWRCGSDGCHPVDRELRVEALREAFDEAGKKPFTKSADDPRDEDVAFFYAEEANHDAEEAIFQELYGTTTTIPPGLEHVA